MVMMMMGRTIDADVKRRRGRASPCYFEVPTPRKRKRNVDNNNSK
jgi:hypothetical protein